MKLTGRRKLDSASRALQDVIDRLQTAIATGKPDARQERKLLDAQRHANELMMELVSIAQSAEGE